MPLLNGMTGPGGQLYADPRPSPDETTFQVNNTSAAYYNSSYYLLHKSQVQQIPPRRMNAAPLNLSDFVSSDVIDAIGSQGKIVFHSVGDTGAAKVSRSQTPAVAIEQEARVADAMSADIENGGNLAPAFFFHLGDVIYNFGEAQYYYDQFYEPFREYDRPIFAIPGNHDGMVFGQGSSAPQVPTLDAFLTNFCAAAPGPSPDAGNLVRSVMTQPGVYFTLDAPYVSIIGLYSNVLEGPGVISSQGGHFPIGDDQLTFLQDELSRLKPQRDKGQRAVLIAVHHPPLSADARHAGSIGIEKDLDKACKSADLWPDAVLSGHAHLYQRFTRVAGGKQTPYIVSGSGGFAATKPQGTVPPAPYKVGDHTLEIDPIVEFGYLTVTTDAQTLSFSFKTATVAGVTERDAVTVNLKTGTIVSAGSGVNARTVATQARSSRKNSRKKPKSARKKK
jgi:calcineurin-like phosphoesterase family protein